MCVWLKRAGGGLVGGSRLLGVLWRAVSASSPALLLPAALRWTALLWHALPSHQCSASTQAHGDRANVCGNWNYKSREVLVLGVLSQRWKVLYLTGSHHKWLCPMGSDALCISSTVSWESALQIRLLCPHCYEEGMCCGHRVVLCFRDWSSDLSGAKQVLTELYL